MGIKTSLIQQEMVTNELYNTSTTRAAASNTIAETNARIDALTPNGFTQRISRTVTYDVSSTVYNFGLFSILWDSTVAVQQFKFVLNLAGSVNVVINTLPSIAAVAVAPEIGTTSSPVVGTEYYFSGGVGASINLILASVGDLSTTRITFNTSSESHVLDLKAMYSSQAVGIDFIDVDMIYVANPIGEGITIPFETDGNLSIGNYNFSFGAKGNTTGTGIVFPEDIQLISYGTHYTDDGTTPTGNGECNIVVGGVENTTDPVLFGIGVQDSIATFATPIQVPKNTTLNVLSKATTAQYGSANIFLQGVIL